ncbi:MAG: hypothetical protein PHN44_12460 [Candidatus Marinimicrobia bacterium]|nr:hypothetical protein [Candidatus Neomarinimicrobiota bacterium]
MRIKITIEGRKKPYISPVINDGVGDFGEQNVVYRRVINLIEDMLKKGKKPKKFTIEQIEG